MSDRITAATWRPDTGQFKGGKLPEFFKSLVDLFAGERAEALHPNCSQQKLPITDP